VSPTRRAGIERRKYIRLSAIARVEYAILGERRLSGKSAMMDMSRDGVRFSVREKLRKGTLLDLKIDTGRGEPPIVARVKEVWCKKLKEKSGFDVGALFVKIAPADKDRLLDYAYRFWVDRTRKKYIKPPA